LLEAAAGADAAPGQVDGLPDTFYAQMLMRMHEVQDRPLSAEVMCVRIGDAAVVGLSSEVFCGLANDWFGYLLTQEASARGGYEPTPESAECVAGAGEPMVEAALADLRELFG
jgi:hypothetical protein